jgi:dolichol-phosphate mannosyltransferase
MNNTKISIIIPTYKEEKNIPILIKEIHKFINDINYEIIIVDDNSPDNIENIVKELSEIYPVKIIVRKNERGLATAVVEGFKHASGDIFVVMDADLQHPPEKITCLIEKILNGNDIAIASRLDESEFNNFNSIRKLQSKVANLIGHVLIPKLKNIKDLQSGFFAIRKEVIDGVELKPKGFKILLEILAIGKYKNLNEVSCTLEKRRNGETKLTKKLF